MRAKDKTHEHNNHNPHDTRMDEGIPETHVQPHGL